MTEVDEEDHVYYRFQGIEKLNLNTTTAFTLAKNKRKKPLNEKLTNKLFLSCCYFIKPEDD